MLTRRYYSHLKKKMSFPRITNDKETQGSHKECTYRKEQVIVIHARCKTYVIEVRIGFFGVE